MTGARFRKPPTARGMNAGSGVAQGGQHPSPRSTAFPQHHVTGGRNTSGSMPRAPISWHGQTSNQPLHDAYGQDPSRDLRPVMAPAVPVPDQNGWAGQPMNNGQFGNGSGSMPQPPAPGVYDPSTDLTQDPNRHVVPSTPGGSGHNPLNYHDSYYALQANQNLNAKNQQAAAILRQIGGNLNWNPGVAGSKQVHYDSQLAPLYTQNMHNLQTATSANKYAQHANLAARGVYNSGGRYKEDAQRDTNYHQSSQGIDNAYGAAKRNQLLDDLQHATDFATQQQQGIELGSRERYDQMNPAAPLEHLPDPKDYVNTGSNAGGGVAIGGGIYNGQGNRADATIDLGGLLGSGNRANEPWLDQPVPGATMPKVGGSVPPPPPVPGVGVQPGSIAAQKGIKLGTLPGGGNAAYTPLPVTPVATGANGGNYVPGVPATGLPVKSAGKPSPFAVPAPKALAAPRPPASSLVRRRLA